MAWNPEKEVAVARAVAQELKADIGCVIIWVNKDTVGMASYGHTKALCDKMGKLGNVLHYEAMEHISEANETKGTINE